MRGIHGKGALYPVTDWHCHILPGIDDGPAEMEQSLEMATALSAAGFREIYCTPHFMQGCYEAGNDTVRHGVDELQNMLDRRGIPLILHPGREYCLDEYLLSALDDPLTLGDSREILVEIHHNLSGGMVRHLLYDVVRSGFSPVIAHPERCPLLLPGAAARNRTGFLGTLGKMFKNGKGSPETSMTHDSPGNPLLSYLRDLGCSFQGNLGSFHGYYGRQVRSNAIAMRSLGIYDRYGSDLHVPDQAALVLLDLPPIP